MVIDISTALGAAAAAITVIASLFGIIRKFLDSRRKQKQKDRESILKEAKNETDRFIETLELKITKIEDELKNQKESISKDLSHLKENYSSEIKGLAEKIENIREQLNQQHIQLVALLTRMIDNK